jgi:hypothetical protein
VCLAVDGRQRARRVVRSVSTRPGLDDSRPAYVEVKKGLKAESHPILAKPSLLRRV